MRPEELAVIVSVLALGISAYTWWRQLVRAHHANALRVLVDMFHEFRDPKLVTARARFMKEDAYDAFQREYPPEDGFPDTDSEAGEDMRLVSHFFDNLGVLVFHKTVDIKMTIGFLGISADELWKRLAPYIRAERGKREADYGRPPYQAYFEHLVAESRRRTPESVLRKLRTISPEHDSVTSTPR